MEEEEIINYSDCTIVTETEETNVKIYKFNKDIYDTISSFLEITPSNDHFYIVNLHKIVKQFNRWKAELPNVKPFYAIKSNPDHMILKTLCGLGCGFDCASKPEIIGAFNAGAKPENIIYANPCKEFTHLQYARAHDVDLLTFDSETELYKVNLYHPGAKLIIRIKVDDRASMCKFSSKFGVDIEEVDDMIKIVHMLKLNLVGVSFHVGSNCSESGYFDKAIKDCKYVFELVKNKYGKLLSILDIGGGFPGYDYGNRITFSEIANEIRQSLDTYFKEEIENGLEVIAEPGRFFCTRSHTLVCNIIGIKKDKKSGIIQYTINEGIYGSFSSIVFDYAHPFIKPFNERNTDKCYESVIFGPTCDSLDKINDKIMLPELALGDWIYVENFGAYTRASSTTFNGFQPGKVYYVISETDN